MSIIDRSGAIRALGGKLRQVGRAQIGRLLGTVPHTSGAYRAWIDLLERCYFMRAELNATASLLIRKGIITEEEWAKAYEEELEVYFAAVAKDWPEIEFQERAYVIKDASAFQERARREGWPP